jgi:hypothetical protein
MPAKQVLDIVLGGRDHDINTRFLHQPIEAMMVEWDRKSAGFRCFH